jgi:ATP-dependent DNA helicase RecQ
VLALTASATPAVQNDICEKLGFVNPAIFRQSFARPNLSYSVFKVESKLNRILDIVRKVNGSGIVYCRSRKRTKEISDLLLMHGIKADFYHAGLTQEQRNQKQEDWIQDRTRIIACTNAFGMGIDKPTVRIVVHADVPDCLENYYQEAGRAGRDGLKSYAALLYDKKDIDDLRALPTSRYPPLETIRKVYSDLMNFLQIPSASGEGQYFSFDLSEFIKQKKFDTQQTIACFKTLEQEEHLGFNEQVFIQSKIQFTTGKEQLYAFEETNPALEPLIKSLLRSYEGIFDQPVTVNEMFLAGLNKRHVDLVIQDLQILHKARIIEYVPKKDTPQIYLYHPRVATQDLRIDMAAYNKRRKIYTDRLQKMIEFLDSSACRSQEIGTYFGDAAITSCGICDNCLQKKRESLAEREFSVIHDRIMDLIREGSVHTNKLYSLLEPQKKERISEVLSFMQGENKIRLNDRGEVTRC